MEFSEIKPFIRYAEKINDSYCNNKNHLLSYDHIMLYTMSGKCTIGVDNNEYTLKRGSLIIIKPGMEYIFLDSADLEAIILHFDYNNVNSIEKAFYIAPSPKNEFRKNQIIDIKIQTEQCFNSILSIEKYHHMEEHFKIILSEFKQRNRYFDFKTSAVMTWILIDISRHIYNTECQVNTSGTGIINDVINYIHENYNKDITNESISKEFNFHSKYINVLIKNKTGYSLHQYILLRRITKAIDYLQNTNMHIYEISEKVGFSDSCHFTKCFKQLVGESPKAFRKNINTA